MVVHTQPHGARLVLSFRGRDYAITRREAGSFVRRERLRGARLVLSFRERDYAIARREVGSLVQRERLQNHAAD
jgi:hypothetical protein